MNVNIELRAWMSFVHDRCNANEKGIECREAYEIKRKTDEARGTDYYIFSDDNLREGADRDRAEKDRELLDDLAYKWLVENPIDGGAAGATCSEFLLCQDQLCCGDMEPEAGALGYLNPKVGDVCGDATLLKYTDGLGQQLTHVCTGLNAMKIGATVATAIFALT